MIIPTQAPRQQCLERSNSARPSASSSSVCALDGGGSNHKQNERALARSLALTSSCRLSRKQIGQLAVRLIACQAVMTALTTAAMLLAVVSITAVDSRPQRSVAVVTSKASKRSVYFSSSSSFGSGGGRSTATTDSANLSRQLAARDNPSAKMNVSSSMGECKKEAYAVSSVGIIWAAPGNRLYFDHSFDPAITTRPRQTRERESDRHARGQFSPRLQ